MIKKLTLASVATLALVVLPVQAENTNCQAQMTKQSKSCKGALCDKGQSCEETKTCTKTKSYKNMHKKGHDEALLLHLPSPMRIIMKYEDDVRFGLNLEQKKKLADMRNQMMPKMLKLQDEIHALSKEIKTLCKAGSKLADMKDNVEKLAKLKIHATMTKLGCIEKVKEVLNDEQETFIKELRKARMEKREQFKGMKNAMKCKAVKCGDK